MDKPINNDQSLFHFGVPGMKWGIRRANRYNTKAKNLLNRASSLEAKGRNDLATMKREAADIYKKRAINAKEIGKMGQQIRNGTSLINKFLNKDVKMMNVKLAKGRYTATELKISNMLAGSSMTMSQLLREKLLNG